MTRENTIYGAGKSKLADGNVGGLPEIKLKNVEASVNLIKVHVLEKPL